MLLTGFMSNIQLELLEELRDSDKTQVHPYCRHCRHNGRQLEDIQNGGVIGLDDDAGLRRFNQMSDFFNHPHKTCNLELHRPVILLGGSKEPRKKEKWLDQAADRPTALRQIFIARDMKNNRSKSKLLGGVQINP